MEPKVGSKFVWTLNPNTHVSPSCFLGKAFSIMLTHCLGCLCPKSTCLRLSPGSTYFFNIFHLRFTPQMAISVGAAPELSQCPGASFGSLPWVQEPKDLDNLPVYFQTHRSWIRELVWALGFWIQPGPAPHCCEHLGMNQLIEDFSLSLCFSVSAKQN